VYKVSRCMSPAVNCAPPAAGRCLPAAVVRQACAFPNSRSGGVHLHVSGGAQLLAWLAYLKPKTVTVIHCCQPFTKRHESGVQLRVMTASLACTSVSRPCRCNAMRNPASMLRHRRSLCPDVAVHRSQDAPVMCPTGRRPTATRTIDNLAQACYYCLQMQVVWPQLTCR